jgi:hypothetical protein
MKFMKIILARSYHKPNRNTTFVYRVIGNPSDLEAFKNIKGKHYCEDSDGTPLWFTTCFVGREGKLIITDDGEILPDMGLYDQAASIVAQYGGDLGQELARLAADKFLGLSPTKPSTTLPGMEAHTSNAETGLNDL